MTLYKFSVMVKQIEKHVNNPKRMTTGIGHSAEVQWWYKSKKSSGSLVAQRKVVKAVKEQSCNLNKQRGHNEIDYGDMRPAGMNEASESSMCSSPLGLFIQVVIHSSRL